MIIERKLNDRMARVENNSSQQVIYMEELAVQVREQNQLFLEKVKMLVGNNSSKIELVLKERATQMREIEDINTKIVNLNRRNEDLQAAELESRLRIEEWG